MARPMSLRFEVVCSMTSAHWVGGPSFLSCSPPSAVPPLSLPPRTPGGARRDASRRFASELELPGKSPLVAENTLLSLSELWVSFKVLVPWSVANADDRIAQTLWLGLLSHAWAGRGANMAHRAFKVVFVSSRLASIARSMDYTASEQ